MPLNLIMLGPPGAGKGTQAERIARARGIPKISTGDILREAVQAGTSIGCQAKATMARGELVSDEMMIGIVRDRLGRPDVRNGFVLDGFPRTVGQADALDRLMDGRGRLFVFEIVVPEAELVRRMLTRLVCEACGATAGGGGVPADPAAATGPHGAPGACRRCGGRLIQRSDDNKAIVLERLQIYLRQTKPLVEYYRPRPTFRSIDGAAPADSVAGALVAAIEELRP